MYITNEKKGNGKTIKTGKEMVERWKGKKITVRKLYITYIQSSLAMFKICPHVPLKKWKILNE
jgi:hypothetical protein